jgi:hypothetical protein
MMQRMVGLTLITALAAACSDDKSGTAPTQNASTMWASLSRAPRAPPATSAA